LKNDVEPLKSKNFDGLQFPDLYFFQPKKLFLFKDNQVEILYLNVVSDALEDDLEAIRHCEVEQRSNLSNDIKIKLRIHKDAYFEKVNTLLEHIHRGDVYEANFCQEFYAEDTTINPLETYLKLNAISKPPFAAFFKCYDRYLLSASPERYLKKEGDTVISQPIKGTAKRATDLVEDAQLKHDLAASVKERSENTMIVDLVRNDLSKTALKGSVRVEEFCKVYTFKQVHQMISTIVSKVGVDMHP